MPPSPIQDQISQPPSSDVLSILMEEYRQLYELSRLRLNALDRRAPIAAATFAAVLATLDTASPSMQVILLIAIPLSLIWWLATTITHARSFEDALRRIELIERLINQEVRRDLLAFQSSHPSRGEVTGGRTGDQTIQAVLAASAVILGACLTLSIESSVLHGLWRPAYAVVLSLIACALLRMNALIRDYRYRPKDRLAGESKGE